uniref:NF-kappa-B-repressing factor n=1 Tax=Musca domestica TaxID=7370 RepID=A0A1I8MPS9_MUSDO
MSKKDKKLKKAKPNADQEANQTETNDKQQQNDSEFPTDWDVDVYRREYESEEHWLLRKRFMEFHKDKFPEDKLVCLAQVFTNMEFMGCKYPAETMAMVAELSKEVAKEFRAGRANRLKRTFVAASDAAEARAKGRRSAQQTNDGQSTQQLQGQKRKHFDIGSTGETQPPTKKMPQVDLFSGLKHKQFILFLNGGRQCIQLSAQRSHVPFEEKEIPAENNIKKVEIRLNNNVVALATGENLKLAKANAFTCALEKLQNECYTIKQNPDRQTIKIEKNNNKAVCEVIKSEVDAASVDKKLDDNNKGFRMMKMMGWSGGGLGSKKQGREDPVEYLFKSNRSGLGKEDCKMDKQYFKNILRNYVESDDIRELQFEPTFTKEERALLHEIAKNFNLKSSSYGQGEQRRLIITKKTITDNQILHEVLINKNTRFLDRYLVQVPKCKRHIFPDHTETLTL